MALKRASRLQSNRSLRASRPLRVSSRVITDSMQPNSSNQHPTIDGVVDGPYTTKTLSLIREAVVAFVRRKGSSYYLVHNVRRQEKFNNFTWRGSARDRELRTTWSAGYHAITLSSISIGRSLREQVNSRVELFDIRSPYVQNLMHSLRNFNLDLADLSPPLLLLADRANSSRELVTQLRLLRSTLDMKLDQFERSGPRNPAKRKRVPVEGV